MRNRIWVAGTALAFGCAMFGGSQESKKSETRTAQDQAQQSLQRATDAQKKAADEQAKVEQAQQEVTQKHAVWPFRSRSARRTRICCSSRSPTRRR